MITKNALFFLNIQSKKDKIHILTCKNVVYYDKESFKMCKSLNI